MSDTSVSNTTVSQPLSNQSNIDVFMNGMAWSSTDGLFIVTDQNEILLDKPLPRIER